MTGWIDFSWPWCLRVFLLVILLCSFPVLTGCNEKSGGVLSGAHHSASLSWVAPSQRVNGERLSMAELGGYTIRYGQDPQRLARTVEIEDPYVMEREISNLTPGTWFFAIQSRDHAGNLSPLSRPVSKSIP